MQQPQLRRGLSNCRRCSSYPQQSFHSTFKASPFLSNFAWPCLYCMDLALQAERTQKRGGMVMCATVLVIMCFIMLVLLVLKTIVFWLWEQMLLKILFWSVSTDIPEFHSFIVLTLPSKSYMLVDGSILSYWRMQELQIPWIHITKLTDYPSYISVFFSPNFVGKAGRVLYLGINVLTMYRADTDRCSFVMDLLSDSFEFSGGWSMVFPNPMLCNEKSRPF